MKKILFLLFLLLSISAAAQKMPDSGFDKVRIAENDKTILAEIIPVNKNPKANPTLYYYWYSANVIHLTQGGFSGKLLNGSYDEFYANNNLKQQGNFKKGLKDGVWKSWDENGTLTQVSTWKNGILLTKPTVSFWKKLNMFKKTSRTQPDTTSKK